MQYRIRMMREDGGAKEYADDVVAANSMAEAVCAAVRGRKSVGGWTAVAWETVSEGETAADQTV